jgi:hypothetical protein
VTDALPVFEATVPVMMLGVAAWRLPYAMGDRQHRPLWMIFTTLGVLTAIGEPAVGRPIDRALGVHDISVQIAFAVGLIMAVAMVDYIHSVAAPQVDIRRWFAISALTAGLAMTILFIALPRPVETGGTNEFLVRYAGQDVSTAYMMIFVVIMGTAVGLGFWMFWTAARAATRSAAPTHLRVGLYLSAMGLASAVTFFVEYMSFELTHLAGWRLMPDDATFTTIRVLQVATSVFFIVGTCTLRAALFARATRDRRSLRELEPLWRLLRAAVPYITLDAEVPVHGNSLRLHRRVIEIRDGIVALRDYVTADVVAAAHASADRVPLDERAAAVEVLEIIGAIRARDHGVAPTVTSFESPFDGVSFDSEVDWLRQVSRALRSGAVRTSQVADTASALDHQRA